MHGYAAVRGFRLVLREGGCRFGGRDIEKGQFRFFDLLDCMKFFLLVRIGNLVYALQVFVPNIKRFSNTLGLECIEDIL